MEKYPHIIKALSICSDFNTTCSDCPYKEKSRERIGRTCKQALYHDAMEALAAEETRADNLQEWADDLQERADDFRKETEMLAAENAKLREELKNRPEVGFDAETFDKTLEAVLQANGVAKYWHGYAEALEWVFREITFANQEGGDDV